MAGVVPRPAPQESTAALEARGLTRRFGSKTVLQRVDLAVDPGRRAGIWGPNGSGKTTLLRCLAGTLAPSEGHAFVLGHPAASREARSALGVCLGQERAFYGRLSGRENLLFVARLRLRSRSVAGAVEAVCDELALGSFVDRPVEGYSSGMRARLALGRALLGDPRVLLLDEPTRSLDESAGLLVWAALRRRVALTVVVASPRREDLTGCTDIIDLVAMAPPERDRDAAGA